MNALIQFNGCGSCSLKAEHANLQSPTMPMCYPSEQSKYRVLMVGEAPGEQEDEAGKPFVGKAGRYLKDCIPQGWEKRLYWTNTVRCRPPRNRTPETQEVECCAAFLQDDLLAARPHLVIGLGNVAVSHFWPGQSVTNVRGLRIPIQLKDGTATWFFSAFHPSYVMRSNRDKESARVQNPVLPVFKADLNRAFGEIDRCLAPPKIHGLPTILYPRTPEEAETLFDSLQQPFAVDIETFQKKPYMHDARLLTAAFSDGKTTFAFPVDHPQASLGVWNKAFFIKLMQKRKMWIAHNASFELAWIWYLTKDAEQMFEDTMALARLIHKRTGILSLSNQSVIHLGRDYKAETKVDATKALSYPLHKLLEYNALDAYPTDLLWEQYQLPINQDANYRHVLDAIRSTVAMELAGLDVDLRESEKLERELGQKFADAELRAAQLPEVREFEKKEGKKFSIASPKVLGRVITEYCGIPLPKTGKDNYTTAEGALQELVGQHPIIDLTLDYREIAKLRSTYVRPFLDGSILGVDGRMHPAYTTVHTRTYRLSSEDPNIQNFPKRKHREVRRQVVAPKGYILLSCDYGQLEVRVLAMASQCPNLCRAIINKVDIHSKWLQNVISRYPSYMDRLRDKTGQTEEKKILKAGRDIIKTDFVFASFYGSHAKSVSHRTMLPFNVCDELLYEFWKEYYGVKKWVDNQFRFYEEHGYVSSLTGRIRDSVLDGNEPINTPIQGTGAEIVIAAQNALYYRSVHEDPLLMPRINIHDDLGFLLPDNDKLGDYVDIITKEMVKPRYPFVIVPQMVEAKIGYNWADGEDICKVEGDYFKVA